MADYRVGCGIAGIYAGTLNKKGERWVNKSLVTDEAIEAVVTYMVGDLLGGISCKKGNTGAYTWERKDGKVIELRVTITEEE